MNDDEIAALAVALEVALGSSTPQRASDEVPSRPSRWKAAGRRPELELEELRAL